MTSVATGCANHHSTVLDVGVCDAVGQSNARQRKTKSKDQGFHTISP